MEDPLVHINRNAETFAPLRSTLVSWLRVQREYSDRVPKNKNAPNDRDYTCWYRERPQVGFLAIAAWLNRWAVLEEWGTEKKKRRGRCDLWIGRGEIQLFIEAKHGWCFIEKGEHHIDKDLRNKIGEAESSARALKDDPFGKRIAAAFVSPVWRPIDRSGFDKARALWIRRCTKAAEAVAMIVPDRGECPTDRSKQLWVGSALLLNEVQG
jgi:hypothetical protein